MDEILCPRCNSPMALRTARQGPNAGNKFWGCTKYPDCKGTLPATDLTECTSGTTTSLRISGKNLGSIAMPKFCPRCFWYKIHCHFNLPFQIFPGIFSTIDSYSKEVIHSYFDDHKKLPDWLSGLGEIENYVNPSDLHYSRFNIVYPEASITLSGTPDDIYILKNNTSCIVDYKTAKYTETQDELFPMYEAQINAYAYIANQLGFPKVSSLFLCYTEPKTEDKKSNEKGFSMEFAAKTLRVEIKPDEYTTKLLKTVRDIYNLKTSPDGINGCKDCNKLNTLFDKH